GYANLVILAPRYLDGVTAQIDRLERERRALEEELHRAQTERPAAKLEETIAAAEGVLWQLQDALQAEDFGLLRELLRQLIVKVELHWTHHPSGRFTYCRFAWGEIHPAGGREVSELSLSAGQRPRHPCGDRPGPS